MMEHFIHIVAFVFVAHAWIDDGFFALAWIIPPRVFVCFHNKKKNAAIFFPSCSSNDGNQSERIGRHKSQTTISRTMKTISVTKMRQYHSLLLLSSSSSSSSSSLPQQPLPPNYQELGEQLIFQAAAKCDINDPAQQVTIDWKQRGRIVVTINTDNAYLSSSLIGEEGDDDDENEWNDDDDDDPFGVVESDESESVSMGIMHDFDFDDDDYVNDDDDTIRDEVEMDHKGSSGSFRVDVVELARAINTALEEDPNEVGWKIAESYEIEVTTPGSSEEIIGNVMWNAYQGFDVICQYLDHPKKKKKAVNQVGGGGGGGDGMSLSSPLQQAQERVVKTIQGRLYGRDDECTTINLKGRLKRIKNEHVVSVKLPKAKREKGG